MRRVPALAARAAIFFGALLPLLGGGAARAGEPPKIVIVAAQDEDAIVTQLRAELRTMGFNVVVADASSSAFPREELEKTARDNSAVAAILVRPSRAGLEVWIIDRITGKTLLRDVVATEGTAGRDATVALRAVELLRASLMEIDAPHPPRGDVSPPAVIREIAGLPSSAPAAAPSALPSPPAWPSPPPGFSSPAQPSSAVRSSPPTPRDRAPKGPEVASSSPLFGVDVAAAILASPGGLAALPALELGVHVWLHRRISVDVGTFLPIGSVQLKAAEGQSQNRVTLFLAGGRVSLARPEATWVPTLGAGATLIWLRTDGVGAPNFVGKSNDGFSGAPFLRPGLRLALGSRIDLHADLLAGVAVRRLVVDYAGRDAATWGTPFFAGSLGVEISSP
jgi:hypothetical protein